MALVEQQNALQKLADDAGYKVVAWYVEGDGVELSESALSGLMGEVVSEGREFNAVLIWNYSRLSRDPAKLAELVRTMREHGVDLVFASENSRVRAFERQLAELTNAVDEEAAI